MESKRSQIERIFNAALEIESLGDRDDYLEDACEGDAELKARVEKLLQAHAEAGSFLERPVLRPDATQQMADLTEGEGTRIGRYKLLQLIGEGGFGVVYMAEQEEPVRRKVALKIIKLGMDTKQVIARFEAERQALAMMDHPNIARVLDAGATDTGRPYFVMELVRGVPITEYCDHNKLQTRDRLQLFVQVCRAIQHAHQKGIIHRDIKPSNVLVTLHDSRPVPKVIDFGIAKATSQRLTEKTLFTEYRQFIGTPEYMSPDQAAISGLDVDTRTDIYSLGVLLYELLTGSTPIDPKSLRNASYTEILRIIREVEPPRPSVRIDTLIEDGADVAGPRHVEATTLSKLVRGDLDWIVMKAMDKDRTRRYENASELAGDVERYLNDETVLATPPTFGYRLQKFVRRHRGGVMATGAIAAALVVGLSLATYGLLEARREAYRSQRIADFLENLFVSTNPDRALGRGVDVESVVATAREVFGEDHGTLAATLSSRALQLQSAGELEAAEQHYRESLRHWRQSYGDENINVADTYRGLGILQLTMGDDPGAEISFREAIRITRALPTGRTLTLSGTLALLAQVLGNRSEYKEAIALLRESVAIRREVAPGQRLQLAITTNELANMLVMSGDAGTASSALKENVTAWREALPPQGPMLAQVLTQTAVWHFQHQDQENAEPLLREALGVFRSIPEPPPRYHWAALQVMSSIRRERDEWTALVPVAMETVDVAQRLVGKSPTECCSTTGPEGDAMTQLANVCWELAKKPERTREEYEVALVGAQKYLQKRADGFAVVNTLGVLQYRLGSYDECLETLARSDAHYSEQYENGVPADVAFIAMAHHELGQEEEARAALDRLHRLMEKPENTNRAENQVLLAEADSLIQGEEH